MGRYRSIFLEPGWQHQRYLGWCEAARDADGVVLERKHGPLVRRLVIAKAGAADLAGKAARLRGPFCETVIHDLAGSNANEITLARLGYRPLGKAQRLLNIATFVLDLAQDEAALLAAMSADTRRKLRKAETSGCRFEARSGQDEARAFASAFNRMALERALAPIDGALVARMIADGAARLFHASSPGGYCGWLLAYLAGDKAIFLQGTATGKDNDGAGCLLQWGVMLALKRAGLRWYDMGGVAGADSSDGIFRFKKGFGGELFSLGAEWGRSGAVVRLARALKR